MRQCKNPKLVLMADDDEDDRVLMGEAFKDNCNCIDLQFVQDGAELLEFLQSPAIHPDLIILDLNMPRMGGVEVLEKIKNDDELKKIPVIIFTTTEEEDALMKTYCKGANSFIRKPATFERLAHITKVIAMYWCEIVLLPNGVKCPPEKTA